MAFPAVANEAVGGRAAERHRDRGAIDIRMTGLAAALALLAGKIGSPALELLVCLAMLADGLPEVKAACAQAWLEGVRDQPA